MRFSRQAILAALWASVSLVDAVADTNKYEVDAFGKECGSDTINIFRGIADENGSTVCMALAAPSSCFTTSVGPDVKGGCIFIMNTNTECTGDVATTSTNNAGQTQNVTASNPGNSAKIVCQPDP